MKIENLNQWLTLIANIGVLLGIVVLMYELNQNNIVAKAQLRNDITVNSMENIKLGQSPIHMEIQRKLNVGEELAFEEVRILQGQFRSELRAWENVHYQYRMGLFDENEMESYRVFWQFRANFCNGLFVPFYNANRLQIEPNFRAEMDGFIAESTC